MHLHRPQGLSLAELLAVLAIVGTLAGLGLPSLAGHRDRAAVQAAADRTLAALQLARAHALSTGTAVTACPSIDGQHCGFGTEADWLLFENRPGGSEARRDPGEPLLQRWALPGGVAVQGTRGHVTYLPQTSAASTATFHFCGRNPAAWRSVVVSQSGRARLIRPASASTAPPAACHP